MDWHLGIFRETGTENRGGKPGDLSLSVAIARNVQALRANTAVIDAELLAPLF